MSKAGRILEKYYDDFGNTGAGPVGVGQSSNQKTYSAGPDPYENGVYEWRPKTKKVMTLSDTELRINMTLRPGAQFRKVTDVCLEVRNFLMTASGTAMDALMKESVLLKATPTLTPALKRDNLLRTTYLSTGQM